MKIKDGKIAEATESELFDYYISRGFDDIMSFKFYIKRCEDLGTIIKEENMRPKKKLPKYDDVIFFKFEDAKRVRDDMVNTLRWAKKKWPNKKNFVSVFDLKFTIHCSKSNIDYKIVEGFKPGDQVVPDNIEYGWTKRPGIYEVENGNPSAGYIFEEPVYLF